MKRASSLRGTEWPTPLTSVAIARSSHRGAGRLDGLHDVLVAGAAADVAADRPPDLLLARVVVLGEQRGGDEHHPRRAEAALQGVLLVERGLDRVQLRAAREALDGLDLAAVRL